jgi:cell division protein FtsB
MNHRKGRAAYIREDLRQLLGPDFVGVTALKAIEEIEKIHAENAKLREEIKKLREANAVALKGLRDANDALS